MRVRDELHEPFSGKGVNLAFGRTADARIIHVDDSVGGRACGCVCPGCGAPLWAKKGPKSRHHFSHAPSSEFPIGCDGGHMTALHRYAQQVIADRLELTIPAIAAGWGDERRETAPAVRWTFDRAELERSVGPFVADVLLHTRDAAVYVEVMVTHPCEPTKVAAMRAEGHRMIEIDVSRLPREIDRRNLDDEILHLAPRHWVSNSKVAEIEAEIERLRLAREAELDLVADELRAAHEAAARAALADDPSDEPLVDAASRGGWIDLIRDAPDVGIGLFTVHPHRWRAIVLACLMNGNSRWSVDTLRITMQKRGYVNDVLARRMLTLDGVVMRSGVPWATLRASLESFLEYLRNRGAAVERGPYWSASTSIVRRVNAFEEAEIDRVHARTRRIELQRALEGIADRLRVADRAVFEAGIGRWHDRLLWGLRPTAIAEAGGEAWEQLARRLSAIGQCLSGIDIEPPGGLGLPAVSERLVEIDEARRMRRASAARQATEREAEKKAVMEAQRKAEADRREADLRTRAAEVLGAESEEWLAKAVENGGPSRVKMARETDRGFDHGMRVLARIVREEEVAERWREELWRKAARYETDPDRLKLLLTTSYPKLPGRRTMLEFCRDEQTMEQCLAFLRPEKRR